MDDFVTGTTSADAETERQPVAGVLGAAGGLGSALAELLAGRGVRLLLAGRRREPLEQLADRLPGSAEVAECDGSDFGAVERFVRRLTEMGKPVGLANCSGSLLLKPAHLTTTDELQAVLEANLTTAFACVRAAGKLLARDGGSVVLVSSAAAQTGLPNHEAIAAAKAAVEGLTRSASATYARRGLRINAVAPGLMDTPLTSRILSNERALEASLALHAVRRPGRPHEVASLIAWLLGPDSGWVTGQVWGIDGGLARLKAGG